MVGYIVVHQQIRTPFGVEIYGGTFFSMERVKMSS